MHIFWVDERYVPPWDTQSNFRLANETWLVPAKVPTGNIHRVPTEAEPHEAARQYAGHMRAFFQTFFGLKAGETPQFDVIHRGMGPDAHTASLFPGEPLIADHQGDQERLAAAVWVDKMHQWRLTLLPGVLEAARNTVVLATGSDKAGALEAVLERTLRPGEVAGADRGTGGKQGNLVCGRGGLRSLKGSAEGNGMRQTRRDILPLLGLPVLGVFPFSRTAEQTAPEPARTRLILGGDVMLSRHVGKVARRDAAIRPFPCAIWLLCSSRPISRS